MYQVDGNNPGGKEASASERFTPVTQRYRAPVHGCHSLWDVSKGLQRLGCGRVRLDVFPRSVLDLTLLHKNLNLTGSVASLS